MKSWIHKQIDNSLVRFDEIMDTNYPDSKTYSKDAKLFIEHIINNTNYIEAFNSIKWESYFKTPSNILDLACGIGWVSAKLSKLTNVNNIYCVDSSKFYVKNMLPKIFDHLKGDKKKVIPIEGMFYPILLKNNSLDGVVLSAAIHHSTEMEKLLNEIHRVLKPGGFLFILNENPLSNLRFILKCSKFYIKVFIHLLFKKYNSSKQILSYTSYLDDPDLGDNVYPEWVLLKILENCTFEDIKKINSGFLHSKNEDHARNDMLIHYICKKREI